MYCFLFSMVQHPQVGQALIIEASRTHSVTRHSVGLLWRSDQPDAGGIILLHKIIRSVKEKHDYKAVLIQTSKHVPITEV
jgi:hypothetical protein